MIKINRKLLLAFFLVLAIIVTGCTEELSSSKPTNNVQSSELIVHYIDVGQADSILIELPTGETSLIDGGNRDDAELIVKYLRSLDIKSIDYLIATHPHEDHIGGLPDVIRNFDIGKVYMPELQANTKIFEELLTEIKNKGLKIAKSKGGEKIIESVDLQFSILAPNNDKYTEVNEYSIVSKLIYKNNSFLFTGDAEKVSEKEMIDSGYDLVTDVLKIGHHGGRTSSSLEFLNKVRAKYAVISVEKGNSYGHPHEETLKRLVDVGTEILRTDILGTIVAISNGNDITFDGINISKLDNEDTEKSKTNGEYIIGNKNTKVYHDPNCNSLPNEENQVIFQTKEDAEAQDYRPHKTCIE